MKEWISLGLAGGSSGGLGMAGQMDTLSQSVNANVENHLCTHLRLWHACVCSDVHILVFHYYLMSLTYPWQGRGVILATLFRYFLALLNGYTCSFETS